MKGKISDLEHSTFSQKYFANGMKITVYRLGFFKP